MEKFNLLTADLLDIIFEYRNKLYGAYELRRTYSKRLTYAISGTVLVCLLFVAGAIFANGKGTDVWLDKGPDVFLTKYDEPVRPVEPPPPPPPPVEPPRVAMTQFTPPVIVVDEDVKPEDVIKPMDDMANTLIGTKTEEGITTDIVAPLVEKPTGIAPAPKVEQSYDEPFRTVQIEAQFTGGLEAWARFLRRNLNSDIPADQGAPPSNYTVIVSFIVDRNGTISDVRAENDPGYGTAAEAIRVIKKSPNWTPAIQNGLNVIYRQKQAITFQVRDN